MSPLVLVFYNRHFDTAVELIERGADVNQWDWWGRSPLYLTIELNRIPDTRRGDLPALDEHTGLDVARLLIARGANVNMRLKHQPMLRNEPGDRGFTDGGRDDEAAARSRRHARRPHDGAHDRLSTAARRGAHGRARRRVPRLERGHRVSARARRADRCEADERRRRD